MWPPHSGAAASLTAWPARFAAASVPFSGKLGRPLKLVPGAYFIAPLKSLAAEHCIVFHLLPPSVAGGGLSGSPASSKSDRPFSWATGTASPAPATQAAAHKL